MANTVDARGLSCPQPVMMALDAMKKAGKGSIKVLVDTDTAKGNVSRAADSQGWTVADIAEDNGEYALTLTKA
ncbi:MAG: sulfurtransferase TusA family protein [Desulfatibacillaceae bacterium]|nr:sulfurtransferase TusA family protein [Desulfatibacillaceae bacterium]